MDKPIYVIGHKNPDADSICSALAYACYKKESGHSNYIAARCGNSNSRIDTILQKFETELPLFVGDVSPRLKDIMIRDIKRLDIHATCRDALKLMDE